MTVEKAYALLDKHICLHALEGGTWHLDIINACHVWLADTSISWEKVCAVFLGFYIE